MARSKRALGGVGRFRAARAARREGRSRERGPSGARRPVRGMRAGSPVAPRQPGPVARRSPLRPRRRQRRGRSVGAGGVAGGVGAGGLHALGAGRGSRAGDTGRAAGEDGCASLADGARVRGGPRDGLTRGRARRQRARACRLCALARGAGVVWRGSRRDRGAFVRRAARRCDVALRRGRRARAPGRAGAVRARVVGERSALHRARHRRRARRAPHRARRRVDRFARRERSRRPRGLPTPSVRRALFLGSTGALCALFATWLLLAASDDERASSWRLHAMVLGAAGPVAALALLHVLEVAPAPMPLRLYALLPVTAVAATWLVSLLLRRSSRLPRVRAAATK